MLTLELARYLMSFPPPFANRYLDQWNILLNDIKENSGFNITIADSLKVVENWQGDVYLRVSWACMYLRG